MRQRILQTRYALADRDVLIQLSPHRQNRLINMAPRGMHILVWRGIRAGRKCGETESILYCSVHILLCEICFLGHIARIVGKPIQSEQVVPIVKHGDVGDRCPHGDDKTDVFRSGCRGGADESTLTEPPNADFGYGNFAVLLQERDSGNSVIDQVLVGPMTLVGASGQAGSALVVDQGGNPLAGKILTRLTV